LKLLIDVDTLEFHFNSTTEDYLSWHVPVAIWSIRIFKDYNYAKNYYFGTEYYKEIKPFRKLYSFTCDWCDGEYFNVKY
jgi:hypothetical protein